MSDPSQNPPAGGVGAAVGARGEGSGGALLRYGGGVGARGGRGIRGRGGGYSAGRPRTTPPPSLPPSTTPSHSYAAPYPQYHSYRGGGGGRGSWTSCGGGRQPSTSHQSHHLYYPPIPPSPMARPHRNKSLVIINPAPTMALPVAPPLPLTIGNSLNSDSKMLPAEEKEKRAVATAVSATCNAGCDDDVQLDRDILEMMASYRNAIGSMARGEFSHPHPSPQPSNGTCSSPSSFSTRKRSHEIAARREHEEKKRRK